LECGASAPLFLQRLLLAAFLMIGAVAPGYFADLVAIEGDPLADINVVLNNVKWVMKAGAVVVDKRKGKTNH